DQTETDPTTTPEDGDGDEASPTTADDAEPSPTDEVATEDPADDDAPEFMPADEDAEEPAAAHTGEQQDDPADTQEITDVEITAHEGFDRVELHLTGDEVELGWLASFEDEAREAGSGMPIEVEGEAVLLVGINGIDWTAESAQRYDGTTVDGDDTDVITEVVFGTLFEGQQDLYVGVSERAPYRIHAVDDPARILIDVEHP
ncbi:MAG: hypothetical protein Q4G34_07600, partial [Micrococcus sp.]|nr:hypothetical protein [Micrococcus sp.]